MTMPETRSVILMEYWEGQDTSVTQTAIPWCTTHHQSVERGGQLLDEPLACPKSAWFRPPCDVSVGGSDHKWWQDIEARRTP